ncbi:Tetratricopeptide repeat [Chlorella sorokiniana]|uniref:Tetratricopeptide repeat n=1 Tax=Chlorella sorokiniana TaxID=3076 RepID=A0A2P6TPM9_CHLSO|nr:Tetratricopeptide repeat [Chlorella sorokiniana]|eukprot:PRW55985.1 Tetratricopeptide repeat [Chlorella sorokiniana]
MQRQEAQRKFSLGAPRPLLLASISDAAGSGKPVSLLPRLPDPAALQASLQEPLQRLAGRAKAPAAPSERRPHRRHHLRAPDLTPQFAAAAAVAGGVLAAISQAAQRVAAARPRLHGRRPPNMPFHQSFRLPWDRRGTASGSARATREAVALAKALEARGHEYERTLDVRAAVQCFEEACRLVPGSVPYLSMAAKCWSDLTFYYDVRSDRERQLVNLKAIEYAEKCIEAAPQSVFGHVALCVSKGRLALFTDNKTKVRLAKEAQLSAYKAIECDPENDVAHHLMGRWHYEMAQINFVLRTLVRVMYGTALLPGTRQQALDSFRRAAELAPQRLIHKVEAGRVHLELGQVPEGVAQLEAALQCEVEDINAWHTRMDAEKMLAQVRRQPYKQPSLIPPHALQQEAAAAAGAAAAPAASISTAALLSGDRQPEIVAAAVQSAAAADAPASAA